MSFSGSSGESKIEHFDSAARRRRLRIAEESYPLLDIRCYGSTIAVLETLIFALEQTKIVTPEWITDGARLFAGNSL